MPQPLGRCCATCRFAKVSRTPSGRLKRDSMARCECPVSPQVLEFLPAAVIRYPLAEFSHWPRTHLDATEPRDDCFLYEAGQPGER